MLLKPDERVTNTSNTAKLFRCIGHSSILKFEQVRKFFLIQFTHALLNIL